MKNLTILSTFVVFVFSATINVAQAKSTETLKPQAVEAIEIMQIAQDNLAQSMQSISIKSDAAKKQLDTQVASLSTERNISTESSTKAPIIAE